MVKERVSQILGVLPSVERLMALGMIIALCIVALVLSGCAAKFDGSVDSPALSSWLTGEPVTQPTVPVTVTVKAQQGGSDGEASSR